MVFSLFHLLWNFSFTTNNFITKPKDFIQFQVHVPDCSDSGGNHMFLLFEEIDGSPEFWEEENHLHWFFRDWNFKPFAHSFRRVKCANFNVIVLTDESIHHDDHYGNFILTYRLCSLTVHKYTLLCWEEKPWGYSTWQEEWRSQFWDFWGSVRYIGSTERASICCLLFLALLHLPSCTLCHFVLWEGIWMFDIILA